MCLWFLTYGKLECDALRWYVVLNTRALEKLIPQERRDHTVVSTSNSKLFMLPVPFLL